jgi:hypothetical protein
LLIWLSSLFSLFYLLRPPLIHPPRNLSIDFDACCA